MVARLETAASSNRNPLLRFKKTSENRRTHVSSTGTAGPRSAAIVTAGMAVLFQ